MRIKVILLSFLTACSTYNPKPEIALVSAYPVKLELFQTSLKLSVSLDNESNTALDIKGSSCRLIIDGEQVGKALSSEKFTVEPYSRKTFNTDLEISNLKLLDSGRSVLSFDGWDDYQLKCNFNTDSGFFSGISAETGGEFSNISMLSDKK